MAISLSQTAALYIAVHHRAPEPSGLAYWSTQFNGDFNQAAASFLAHPVFVLQHGSDSHTTLIEGFYQKILGGHGDQAGIDYWAGRLDAGDTVAQVLTDFLTQALEGDYTTNSSALIRQQNLQNKIEVALYYAQTMGDAAEMNPASDPASVYIHTDPAYQMAVRALAGVSYQTESVEAAKKAIQDLLPKAVVPAPTKPDDGLKSNPPSVQPDTSLDTTTDTTLPAKGTQDIFLTTAIDQLLGTKGDDIFRAPIDNSNLTGVKFQTLDTGDTVDGDAGYDRLYVQLLSTGLPTEVMPQIKNIEELHLQALAPARINLNASTDIEAIFMDGSFAGTSVWGVQQAAVHISHLAGPMLYLADIDTAEFQLSINAVGRANQLQRIDLSAKTDLSVLHLQSVAGTNWLELQGDAHIAKLSQIVLNGAADSHLVIDASSLYNGAVDVVTIHIGDLATLDYQADTKAKQKEVFSFGSSDFDHVYIRNFDNTSPHADQIDLSTLNLSFDQLTITTTTLGTTIQIPNHQTTGQIHLIGVDLIVESDFIL